MGCIVQASQNLSLTMFSSEVAQIETTGRTLSHAFFWTQNALKGYTLETDLNNMTMRDLFAAFALAGIIANREPHQELAAIHAYNYADAMIEQRNKDATGL